MSDADREMARSYCKILSCFEPDHELLKYRMIVYASTNDVLETETYRTLRDEFLLRFAHMSEQEIAELTVAKMDEPNWYWNFAIRAYRRYYKALRDVVVVKGVDLWSDFWNLFCHDIDELGVLRPFTGRNINDPDRTAQDWKTLVRLPTIHQPAAGPDRKLLINGELVNLEYEEDPRLINWHIVGSETIQEPDLVWMAHRCRISEYRGPILQDISDVTFRALLQARSKSKTALLHKREHDYRARWIELP